MKYNTCVTSLTTKKKQNLSALIIRFNQAPLEIKSYNESAAT